jgi:uncharacterized protein YecE (DUF72 family)
MPKTKLAPQIRIGISGWLYKPWRGTFYPQGLPQKRELEYASLALNSIEINGTFYSLKRPENFREWCDQTPKDFVFSIKGSRFITHIRRLNNIETPLATFLAQGLLQFGSRLGPILWQLPPNFKYDRARFERFFSQLPTTHEEAAHLAKGHDPLLNGRSWTHTDKQRKLRHAVEIRNETFVCEEFIALLRKYNVALVVADTVEWPLLLDVTSDFVYCRLHGSEQLYTSGYDEPALDIWAQRILTWSRGGEVPAEEQNGKQRALHASSRKAPLRKTRDVFVYFDNDAKVRAPFDAQSLHRKIQSLTS